MKIHNFIKKTKARPSAAWWLKRLPGPLPSDSPGGDKPDGSYPGLGSSKHLLRDPSGLWVWGSHLCQQGEQICLAQGASGHVGGRRGRKEEGSGWETFHQTPKQAHCPSRREQHHQVLLAGHPKWPYSEACCWWLPQGQPCGHGHYECQLLRPGPPKSKRQHPQHMGHRGDHDAFSGPTSLASLCALVTPQGNVVLACFLALACFCGYRVGQK